jgi:hypothetical protein
MMAMERLFRLMDEYYIEATLLRTQNPAAQLLTSTDGKSYTDDLATIHVRNRFAPHTIEPSVEPKVN